MCANYYHPASGVLYHLPLSQAKVAPKFATDPCLYILKSRIQKRQKHKVCYLLQELRLHLGSSRPINVV